MKKCDLSEDCPLSHYALRIISGAANAVGPSICFDGHVYVLIISVSMIVVLIFTNVKYFKRIHAMNEFAPVNSIMSHELRNVGPGLNIVQIHGKWKDF